jgi:hypothetical protein
MLTAGGSGAFRVASFAMPLRNFSLRVLGAGERVDECRAPLREAANRLGAHYVTVRPDGGDALINAVFDVRPEGRPDELLPEAQRAVPSETVVLVEEPSRPHEIAAQMVEDLRRGTAVLPGALQAREDVDAWEDFLSRARPRGALELGTASGVFSRWLDERVEWFKTVDIGKPPRRTPGFVHLDVWARPQKVHDLIAKAPRPFVLYCDDGNKRREVETFGPSLDPDDYLAVHDVGTEFFTDEMPGGYEELLVHGLTGFYRKAAAPC